MNIPENPAILTLDNVSKTFRDFWQRPSVQAVTNLSLTLHPGEIFGLLGPNGSGKSTTIKMILGLLRPTGGTIKVLNAAPGDTQVKRRIGYLPEISHLHRFLTPRETLTYYAKLFNLPANIAAQRVKELLHMVGLEDAADRPIGEFSKGMARRVSLAQTLINNPELIILDEPTSGLDPIACREIKDWLRLLVTSGRTILMTSHLLADVEDVCDRIAIMRKGHLSACGEVAALLGHTDSTRFTVSGLSPHEASDAHSLLETITGRQVKQDSPRLDLETFFIKTIAETGESALPTHRAPAAFLVASRLKPENNT